MYKILYEGHIVDVVRNPSFLKFLPSGHIAITDKSSAQGIAGSDAVTVYSFAPIADKNIPVVTIEKITAKEFNRLKSLLNSDQKIGGKQQSDTIIGHLLTKRNRQCTYTQIL